MGLEMGLDGPWGKLDVMGWDWDGTVPKPGNLDGTGNFGHGTTLEASNIPTTKVNECT